ARVSLRSAHTTSYCWIDRPRDKLAVNRVSSDTPVEKRKSSDITMSVLIRTFATALMTSALLMQASYAQELPMSDRQKAAIERHKVEEKATDEAYKAMLKRTQDAKPKADPWGNLRAAPAGGGK
ncbi:MAG: hypothetical protein WBD95_26395, partial [Xanthobacteraceae bacterium]